MKYSKFFAVTGIVILSACNQNKENDTKSATSATKKNAAGAFKEYIELKNALVDTDAEEAKSEAKELQSELVKLQESNADAQAAKQYAETISSTNDIKAQREAFSGLSQSVIKLAKSGIIGEKEYYIQYCPMALDNKGAEWISEEEEIKNPYFGDEMMSCGEVKETVK